MDNYTELLIVSKKTVKEAMAVLDIVVPKILFVVTPDNVLIGALTDGDVRRYLLNGGVLEDSVNYASNNHPITAKSIEEALKKYNDRELIAIPIVDDNMVVHDIYLGKCSEQRKDSLRIPIVINAGGRGTRLDPFTKVLPKPLIPVGELPIIEHIMQHFEAFDCNDFRVIVNYKKQLIKAFFRECERKYNVTWYDETKPLGTGGGLSLLKGEVRDTFIFTSCDTILESDYSSMLKYHRENKNVVTMICAYKNLSIPYGIIEMGLNGSIEQMKEKPELSFLTNTGVYIVEPEVLNEIEDDVAIGFPDIIKSQMSKGKKVAVYPLRENEWLDMGQMSELEKMRTRLYGDY